MASTLSACGLYGQDRRFFDKLPVTPPHTVGEDNAFAYPFIPATTCS